MLGIGVHTSLGCRNRAMVLDETAQTWVCMNVCTSGKSVILKLLTLHILCSPRSGTLTEPEIPLQVIREIFPEIRVKL